MRSLCCSSVFCADDGGGLEIFSLFGVHRCVIVMASPGDVQANIAAARAAMRRQ